MSRGKKTAFLNIKSVNIILSLLFSFAMVAGYQCEHFGYVLPYDPYTYLAMAGVFILSLFLSAWLYNLIQRRYSIKHSSYNSSHIWLKSSVIIWCCYFIVFLGVYPGFFVYDAQYELTETIARNFSNHQPIFHVLYMGGIIQAVHKITGDYNIAIAVFTLAQMTFISIVMGFLVKELNKKTLNTVWSYIFSLYLGIFPVLVMYALCSAKDGVFAAALMLVFVYVRRIVSDPVSFVKSPVQIVLFVLSSALMMLMRSNGMHAYIVFSFIFFIILLTQDIKRAKDKNTSHLPDNKPENKKSNSCTSVIILLACIFSVAIYIVSNKGLLTAVHASDYGSREMLTVPIQQLARVYSYEQDQMTDEEIDSLLTYLPETALSHYNPKCSDLVKLDFNEEAFSKDPASFINLWIKLGLKHPVAYVNAWFMTSYGMWYPGAVIDGYKGNEVFTFTYGDSSYFGYETELPGVRDSKIPFIDSIYRFISLDPTIQRIPVVRMLFSPGFMLWCMLFILGYFLYIKKGQYTVPYLLSLIVILTCLLGPISLVRYSYYLWILVPIGIMDIIAEKHN